MSIKVFLNRSEVATSVSKSLGAAAKLHGLASGLVQPGGYMPENKGQYDQLRRYIHDVVCHSLIDSGHFRDFEFRIGKLGFTTNDSKVNKQKPDLYTQSESSLNLGEVTCSYNTQLAYETKSQKYAELIKFMEDNGYTVSYNIIILDMTDPHWDDEFPSIGSLFHEIIQDLIDNLRIVHSDPKYSKYRMDETKTYNIDRFQFILEDKTMSDLTEKATGFKCEPHKIKSSMMFGGSSSMTNDEYYMALSHSILEKPVNDRYVPNPNKTTPYDLLSDYEIFKSNKPTTGKLPSILQLGCPTLTKEKKMSFLEVITSLRTCNRYGGYLDYILDSLEKSQDHDSRLINLNIDQNMVEKEQQQGPGRKSYLKRKGVILDREQPKHIGISEAHENILNEFTDKIEQVVSKDSIHDLRFQDVEHTGVYAQTLMCEIEDLVKGSPASTIATFYQKISNEIVLNSMRRRKTRQYALGYSGFEGVYFIVAPGPQLRTESNVEFVKIISLTPGLHSALSSQWISVGDHWESNWLSVDTDRLSHWQRAFDKTLMGLLSNSERLVRPGLDLIGSVKEEINYGNYLLLTLVYIENKQLTSTTNQTIRYLWMKALGDKNFKNMMSKFPSRVNSILQSVMLQRSIHSTIKMCETDLSDLVKVARLSRDTETGQYDETTTGTTNLLRRLFTKGPSVPISYNLNEIYWCMAYNKDRQNVTQDSMRILDKILKEEKKYDDEISARSGVDKVKYFLGHTTISEDINHVHTTKPESHFYSMRAVRCGIELQDKHKENYGGSSSWLNQQKLDAILSKKLSDYATFKASVKEIQDHIKPGDMTEIKKLGSRTKAIELTAEIVKDENLLTACEVAMSFSGESGSLFEVMIQIFKKNQIGGTREIIILYIKARILFNIVEELARLLCKSDKREILTKGRDKRLMMRGDYEQISSSFPEGTPIKMIKESYDMTTWCQKFIPTIFVATFEYHFKDIAPVRDLSRLLFLAHSNKRIELPRKLVEQWCKHPDIEYKESYMSKVKNEYLKNGKVTFLNHSNMCQGIPHYNSSVMALSCLSLADKLFETCLKILNINQDIQWMTRVGSDDKGTIIGLNMNSKTSYYQYLLLGQCVHASERLHSMELSVKSASGHVMYELNSAFMANLETLSPTIKFALASTDTIATTSCTSFVNESFSRIRQMRENGCSSILCGFAHALNSRHFYEVFDTGFGGVNDLTKIFKTKQIDIPYDFGIYPQYDIDLQDIIGPEMYNYRILEKGVNDPVKLLYTDISRDELATLFPNDETPFLKKDHFGVNQGMVRQLINMRSRVGADQASVTKFFDKNPFMLIRGPETKEEILNTIYSKLFSKGASESLRRTSAAIYIGRLSAFRSAKAWNSPFETEEIHDLDQDTIEYRTTYAKTTYKDYLTKGLEMCKTKDIDAIKSLRTVLYPQHQSLDVLNLFVGKFGAIKHTEKKFSQAVRLWTVNNFNYEYTSSLKSILETSFGLSQEATKEDVSEFRKLMSMNLDSLNSLIESCETRNIRPIDMFFYMSKLYKSSKTSRVQAFGNGPSSNSLHMTAISLKRYNHIPGVLSLVELGLNESEFDKENTFNRKLDRVKIMHNLIVMQKLGYLTDKNGLPLNINIDLNTIEGSLASSCVTIIRSIKSISGFDYTTKKTIKLVACELLDKIELKAKLISWKTTNFTYIKRQRKTMTNEGRVQWTGDLEVLVSSGNECYTMSEVNGNRFLTSNRITDVSDLYRSMKEMSKTLDFEFHSFFKKRQLKVGDYYLSDSTKMIHRSEVNLPTSNKLSIRFDESFNYRRIVDMDQFEIRSNVNTKTKSIQVYLSDKIGKTATIYHSNGNLYPVELENGMVEQTGDVYLNGVSFGVTMLNKSYFYNYRLPIMSYTERLAFLRNSVNYDIVMNAEVTDLQKIQDYVELRDEVNEDAFTISRQQIEENEHNVSRIDWKSINVNQMFRDAMDDANMPDIFDQQNDDVLDWADEVIEANMDQPTEEDELRNMLNDEDQNVKFIRAFGYKRPQIKKSQITIGALQQASVLKSRVLDCFFKNQNIRNESNKQLPNMYIYLRRLAQNNNIPTNVIEELKKHIVRSISSNTGVSVYKINSVLSNTNTTMSQPIQMVHSMMSGGLQDDDRELLDVILEAEEDDIGSDQQSEGSLADD